MFLSQFVGRQHELGELSAAFQGATTGSGSLFLLSGEAGIGKTRLAEEVAHEARANGGTVLWGRCHEGGGAPAFWPWVQLVRGVAEALPPSELLARLGSSAAPVAALLPELRTDPGPLFPVAAASESEHARFYLFDAMAIFWRKLSVSMPLVLVLDDLHWADKPSLLMLEYVARNLREARCLLIGTFREAQSDSVAEGLAAVARRARTLPLRGLAETEVAQFIQHATRTAPDNDLVAAMHRATDGNPFFVDEVVRMFVAERGRVPESDAPAIPEGVRAVIRRRLALLPEDVRGVLSTASVVGRSFDLELLTHDHGDPSIDLQASVARAVTAGVVEKVLGSVSRYLFVHDLVRETLYEDLPPEARRGLHLRVGRRLEELYPADLESHVTELARHFAEAPGEIGKAIEYASRAGDRTLKLTAYEEAANWYKKALAALAHLPEDPVRRCELNLCLGEALRKAGEVSAARDTFRSAADDARALGSAERLARAALGFGGPFLREAGLVDRELTALLEEALASLGTGDGRLHARLAARLAMELYWSDERERGIALTEEAVAAARHLGSPGTLAFCLNAERQARWGPDGAEDRLRLASEMVVAASRAREPELVQRARGWRITDFLELGKIVEVDLEILEYVRLAEELRLPNTRCWATFIRAMRALLAGRFEEGEELTLGAAELGERAQAPDAPSAFFVQMFTLRREQGRLAELEAPLRGVIELAARIPAWRALLGLLYVETGRLEEARWQLETLAAPGFESLRRDLAWFSCMAAAAELCAALGDAKRAEVLYELLAPLAQRNIVLGAAWACWGSASLALGLLATTTSDWPRAERHFEDALDWNLRMGARPFVARARFHHAGMCAKRGEPGDRERALELLGRSRADAQALGMTNLLEQIVRSEGTQETGRKRPGTPGTRAAPPVNSFRREGDYWEISCDARSFRLKDAKGLGYLCELLHNPGREYHALDLAAGTNRHDDPQAAPGHDDGWIRVSGDPGGAGALLDAQARREYRRRLADLRESLAEAERLNDTGRASAAREEIDLLTAELSRAVGLGGRGRRTGSASERARLSVTMAIKAALRRIDDHDPVLGRHLAMTVKTGVFCSYVPDPRSPLTWTA